MTENEKVAHILKGIAENVFYLIFQKEFSTVKEILDFCREMDEKLSRRLPQFLLLPRLSNTIAFLTYGPSDTLTSFSFEQLPQPLETPSPAYALPTSISIPPPVTSPIIADEAKIAAIVEKVLQRVLPTHMALHT